MICQQHLSVIADRVIALFLSDNDDTPEQINLFLSYASSFGQFTQLRSLSLLSICSYGTLMKILNDCQYLSNLSHLNIYCNYLRYNPVDLQLIINSIWSLPKLIQCDYRIRTDIENFFIITRKISLSLESVHINTNKIRLDNINELFNYTPRLKRLFLSLDSIDHPYISYYTPLTLSTLADLKLHVHNVSDAIIKGFFKNIMPNLYRLDIKLSSNLIKGHQWEQIICNYLPKLEIFRLRMITPSFIQNIEKHADELINSFRTPFWINEHEWFVRCFVRENTLYLYTLSETFYYNDYEFPHSFKSTYPHDDHQKFYNNIINIYDDTFFHQSISSDIHLPNINSLWIKFPINHKFWSIVSSLNQLKSLTVSSYDDIYNSQFQVLLDRAPNLRHLDIRQDKSLTLQMSSFQYINASVHQLDLRNCNHYFTADECITLSRSPLAVQCEVLSILVDNRESIIYLVKNMINLRSLSLNAKFEEKKSSGFFTWLWKRDPSLDENIENKDIVQWLKDCLPSTCLIKKNQTRLTVF
ncbi:unnamed protein product [Rotaria sordida]|uniref:Uncharacterized protein n=1 Tax=Rotaria sordida TaxID=392033 RepID=A0A819SYG4_9BILA|nr:unnamed protein product [Rotaria sordida]CAF1261347.1 unnamed protein product [Rotaria sordida]CAF4003485.1 unnamed protein product [Rotaria sordida]CAF4068812.1 unnamed protein product [Rotaria sordida]